MHLSRKLPKLDSHALKALDMPIDLRVSTKAVGLHLLFCMEILKTSPILVMDGSMAVAHKESFLQDGMRRILHSKPCLT